MIVAEVAVDSMNYTKKVKEAIKLLEEEGFIPMFWHIDDIYQRANDIGYKINDDIAEDIKLQIIHNHDANEGINWDVIDHYLYYSSEPLKVNTEEDEN